jgi:hypothetical protein
MLSTDLGLGGTGHGDVLGGIGKEGLTVAGALAALFLLPALVLAAPATPKRTSPRQAVGSGADQYRRPARRHAAGQP